MLNMSTPDNNKIENSLVGGDKCFDPTCITSTGHTDSTGRSLPQFPGTSRNIQENPNFSKGILDKEIDQTKHSAQAVQDKQGNSIEKGSDKVSTYEQASEEAVQSYEQASKIYETAVQSYEQASKIYETAVETYAKASEEYEKAVKIHEVPSKEYEDAVETYKVQSENYEKAVETYMVASETYMEAVKTFKRSNKLKAEGDIYSIILSSYQMIDEFNSRAHPRLNKMVPYIYTNYYDSASEDSVTTFTMPDEISRPTSSVPTSSLPTSVVPASSVRIKGLELLIIENIELIEKFAQAHTVVTPEEIEKIVTLLLSNNNENLINFLIKQKKKRLGEYDSSNKDNRHLGIIELSYGITSNIDKFENFSKELEGNLFSQLNYIREVCRELLYEYDNQGIHEFFQKPQGLSSTPQGQSSTPQGGPLVGGNPSFKDKLLGVFLGCCFGNHMHVHPEPEPISEDKKVEYLAHYNNYKQFDRDFKELISIQQHLQNNSKVITRILKDHPEINEEVKKFCDDMLRNSFSGTTVFKHISNILTAEAYLVYVIGVLKNIAKDLKRSGIYKSKENKHIITIIVTFSQSKTVNSTIVHHAEAQPVKAQPTEGQHAEGQHAEGQPTEGQPVKAQPKGPVNIYVSLKKLEQVYKVYIETPDRSLDVTNINPECYLDYIPLVPITHRDFDITGEFSQNIIGSTLPGDKLLYDELTDTLNNVFDERVILTNLLKTLKISMVKTGEAAEEAAEEAAKKAVKEQCYDNIFKDGNILYKYPIEKEEIAPKEQTVSPEEQTVSPEEQTVSPEEQYKSFTNNPYTLHGIIESLCSYNL